VGGPKKAQPVMAIASVEISRAFSPSGIVRAMVLAEAEQAIAHPQISKMSPPLRPSLSVFCGLGVL
jgi:hypothetical protein